MDLSILQGNQPLLLSIVLGLAVFVLFLGIDRVLNTQASTLETRFDRYTLREASGGTLASGKRRQNRFSNILGLTTGQQIATELARADLKLTPGEYILINFASIIVGYIIALLLFRGNFILAVVGAIVGFYAPRFYVRFLQGRRIRAFNNQLADTIILLSNSLRSGYSLLQSMETAAKELPPPMSVEFARVTREIGLGLTTEEALANMQRRVPSDDLDLMVTAINVQHEVGGNLAEILDTIAHTIRERVRIVGEIKTITAQQQLTGNILALLPVVLALVIYVINPAYLSHLWSDICGWIMIGVGGTMVVIGYFVVRKIATIEV